MVSTKVPKIVVGRSLLTVFALLNVLFDQSEAGSGGITLHASFNIGGVLGNVTFYQKSTEDNVTISVHLMSREWLYPEEPAEGATFTAPEPKSYAWGIHTFPVLYDMKNPCSSSELGQSVQDMSRKHGPIIIPPPNGTIQEFTDPDIKLRGRKNIWGRSLLLKSSKANDDARTCANILDSGDVKTAEAILTAPIAGKVIFRQGEHGDTTIFSNLFRISADYTPSTRHDWKLMVTDVLDTGEGNLRAVRRCDYLTALYDPENTDDTNCSEENHDSCKLGDLAKKHGQVVIGATNSRYSKRFFVDSNIALSSLEGGRSIYLVVYDVNQKILACAPVVFVQPKEAKAVFNTDGVKGFIRFSQRYRMDPTVVTVNLKNLRGRGSGYHVHLYPVQDKVFSDDNQCSDDAVGGHFNPFEVNAKKSPKPGTGTSDEYEVGDMSGKYSLLDSGPLADIHFGIYADFNLPLFGVYSIIGRSVVIHRPDGSRWICALIGYPKTRTAIANFYYPLAGRIIFRQKFDDYQAETSIFGDLTYSDGSLNNTENHRWDIHEDAPGRDFYNWTKRCESAGAEYNPYEAGRGRQYDRQCNAENSLRCEVGDLTAKHGRITVAARKGTLKNKFFFTDTHLPLSGPYTIIGHSLVIHDDQAPPHRGDRLACTPVKSYHALEVGVKSWHAGRFIESNVTGFVTFHQPSSGDLTDVEVSFDGLNEIAHAYHVHEVSVPLEKEFPCSNDAVYGHYNPFGIDVSLGPAASVGSNDQYEVGDLSGKYGLLDGKDVERLTVTDSNLPLHGPRSIVGRSVVVHKKERNFRWTCGTIEPVYKKENTREIVALASFDHIQGYLQGYVRLRQLEHADGGLSDTWLEVDLRYPGKYDRNITKGHKWSVFVNQVAHDALERTASVRCIAAGYAWNPYIVKNDDEYYKTECGPRNPLRCEMGDLAGKHGPITVGGGRQVFSDINLPLVGNYSVMGRSIIIFDKVGHRLGCANIKPDLHLVRHVTVRKYPGFTSDAFMSHMRQLLNTTDWLVVHDAQQQKDIVNGECVQLTIHFYGSKAHKHHVEFSNLLTRGSVRKDTIYGPRKIETFYKPCRGQKDMDGYDSSSSLMTFSSTIIYSIIIFHLFRRATIA